MFSKKLSQNTKQNKKITMSIQRLHKETIYYAKLLQDAYTEKKKMEIFLKQIIN